jgi:hypothetical protein
MAHPHAHARAHHHAKAHKIIKGAGYKHGGMVHEDAAADRRMIEKGIHEHDRQMHGGKLTKLKLAHGGHVDGHHAKPHMAKRARGGRTGHTKVNVIVAPQGGGAHPVPVPVGGAGLPAVAPRPIGAPAAGAGLMPPQAQRPPMGMGPPGAPPMGGPMGGAPMLRKRGGHIPHMEGGAGSGVGRTEKPHEYGGSRGFKPRRISP